jgi:post-segregation antitoxin (ccd killing protein)
LNGLLQAINLSVLAGTELAERVEVHGIPLSAEAQKIAALPAEQRRKEQNERWNREILEAGLPGILHHDARQRPYYYPLRAAYAYGYSLISWLLIFGCLGLFRTYCQGESRFWRYFSDASYWMYLMHLPIQFQILIWFGDKPWPWPVKFFVYVFGTLAVLIPSYHFLVRPTWIGWLLNGKVVPLRRRVATVEELPAASPVPHPESAPAVLKLRILQK